MFIAYDKGLEGYSYLNLQYVKLATDHYTSTQQHAVSRFPISLVTSL